MGNRYGFRLPEFVTDPSCNQLSASRFVLFPMGLLTIFVHVSAYLYRSRQGGYGMLIAAVAATAAGVYFGSQFKDLRWRRWWNREERQ